jgi:SAM-dependent methyltransferase
MQAPIIRFTDGVSYERFMGRWSQLVGHAFLDWLAPAPGQRWLDVGCGNGAFTELITQRCAPKQVHGIDPSEAQLAHARQRALVAQATFVAGDAMALPYEAQRFDVTVMPLVIFFVPDPARGVAEMVRVAAPGAWVTAYAWDMFGGGLRAGARCAARRGCHRAWATQPGGLQAGVSAGLVDRSRPAGRADPHHHG